MERLGIELLSVFGLPPVEHVELAADLGCRHISSGLTSFPYDPPFYPPFSLRDDPALRKEMVAAMRDRGVTIALGEGMSVRGGMDIRDKSADLAIMEELGVTRVNTVSLDQDLGRSIDQFGILAEMAAERGIETTVEISPGTTIGDLDTALYVVKAVDRSDFRILIDTMHLVRSGSSADDLAAVDPDVIGYIQISDAPLIPVIDDYMAESMFERKIPGTGELPLRDILTVLPRDLVIGLEVPVRSAMQAGVPLSTQLGNAVQATRDLLAQIDNVN